MMKQVIQLGLRLMLFALGAGLLLSGANAITAGPIAQRESEAIDQACAELVAADAYIDLYDEAGSLAADLAMLPMPEGMISVYAAANGYDQAKSISLMTGFKGFVMQTEVQGYGGAVRLMVGVDAGGSVTGLRLLSHSETPGLGAKASSSDFLNQFAGKTGPTLSIVKQPPTQAREVQAITGATITSTAVTGGVEQALAFSASLTEQLRKVGVLP